MPDNTTTDPVQQEFTWEGQGGNDSFAAPTASPSTVPDASPDWAPYLENQEVQMPDAGAASKAYGQPLAAASVTGKQSASGSHSGIAGGPKVAEDLFAGANAKAEADMAPYRAEHQQLIDTERGHHKDLENAVYDEALYQKGFETLNRKLLERQQDFYDHAAALEQQARVQGQAVRAQYIGEYREQLAGVRQLIAQSGNPLESLSRPEALGLGLAQFAQGFLAARGVNIDVSGQVDRWVDRSIKEHQLQIENSRGAAQDTLSLYNIARQSSQDDYEARQRYRGFVIEGLKTAIQANAARFNSGVAEARANQSIAKLQLEQDATERSMGDTLYGKYIQTKTMEISAAKDEGQLKLQKDAQAIEWYKAATARKAAEVKQQKGTGRLLIKDPEQRFLSPDKTIVNKVPIDPKTGQPTKGYTALNEARWEVDPSLPDSVKGKVADEAGNAQSEWADYSDKMKKVLELRAKVHDEIKKQEVGGITGAAGDLVGFTSDSIRRRYSPHYDEYRAAVDEMVAAQLKAETGVNNTPKEQENMRARYPDEKILSNHDGAQIFLNNQEEARKKFERRMERPGLIKVGADDPQRFEVADTASAGIAQDYKNASNGGAPATSFAQGEAAQAAEGSGEHRETTNRAWNKFAGQLSKENPSREFSTSIPDYVTHLDEIAKAVIDPADAVKRHGVDEPPDQIKQQAVDSLERIANDEKLPSDRRKYAAYLIDRIQGDPAALIDDMAGTPTKFQ